MAKKAPAAHAMGVLFGWLPTDSAKDARAYARNIILTRFVAHDESYYGILKFQNGYLWEAHHGGSGKGYLKEVAKALSEDPGGKHWFQAGEKVYRIEMQDGKPFPHLLPLDKSVEVLNSGEAPLTATSSLTIFKSKGTGVLVSGMVAAGLAALYFGGAITFYAIAYNPGPSVRAVDPATMPHAQWSRVKTATLEQIVSKLEFQNKAWNVDMRKHTIDGLKKLKKLRAELERLNREAERQLDIRKAQADAESQKKAEDETRKKVEDAKSGVKALGEQDLQSKSPDEPAVVPSAQPVVPVQPAVIPVEPVKVPGAAQ